MANETYYRPNMANLKGPVGRSIIETIKNTPKPDCSKLRKEADDCLAAIIGKGNDGQQQKV